MLNTLYTYSCGCICLSLVKTHLSKQMVLLRSEPSNISLETPSKATGMVTVSLSETLFFAGYIKQRGKGDAPGPSVFQKHLLKIAPGWGATS